MSISFNSSSVVGSEACLTFTPNNDQNIEDTEQFVFVPTTDNSLDVFSEPSDTFSLMILDDDGMFIDR